MTVEISKSLYKSMKIICAETAAVMTCCDLKNAENFFCWSAYPFIKLPEFIQNINYDLITKYKNKYYVFYEDDHSFIMLVSDHMLIIAAFDVSKSKNINFEKEAYHYFKDLKLAGHFIEIEDHSKFDAMTGLYNHGYFENTLKDWFSNLKKNVEQPQNLIHYTGGPANFIGLIIFDIDNFKKFNDVYGHKTGDIVLIEAARAAERALLNKNMELKLCRYGGEEFVIIGRNISNDALNEIAESVRREIEAVDVNLIAAKHKIGMKLTGITVSVGTAFYDIYSEYVALSGSFDTVYAISSLVEKADTALYGAKQLGKNRVLDYKNIAFECGSVISRIDSQHVLIDLGLKHGLNYESTFLVYDSKYNGHNEVINPKTSKKIGIFPKYLKGELKVSKNLKIFDSVLHERTAVCCITAENDLKIGPGDIIKLKNSEGYDTFNDDIFLSYGECRIDNYIEINYETSLFKSYGHIVMINSKSVIDYLRYNEPGLIRNFYSKIVQIINAAFNGGVKLYHLSSDKLITAINDKYKAYELEERLMAINDELKSEFNIESEDLHFVILSCASLEYSDSDIIKYLRSANFVSRFYFNKELIRYFNLETYRLFGIFCHLCDNNAGAYKILNDCYKMFEDECGLTLFQNLGTIASKSGFYSDAEKYYKLALKYDSDNIQTCSNLALIYASTGRYELARKLYDSLIELKPDIALFYNNLAYCLLELNIDLKAAKKLCLKAVKKASATAQQAEFLDTLASCCEKLGDCRSAETYYIEAIRQSGGAISSYVKLLEFYKRRKDRKNFMKLLKKIKIHPSYFSKAALIRLIAEKFHADNGKSASRAKNSIK